MKELAYGAELAESSARVADVFTHPTKGGFAGGAEEFFRHIPGHDPVTAKSIATAGSSLNPLRVKGGLLGDTTTEFRPFAISERLNLLSDGSRLSTFISELLDGASPAQARSVADAIQVSYNPRMYTKFEREKLKRIFPFYSYASRMLPEIIKEIARRPGGPLAMAIKASSGAHSDERFIPKYVGEGIAIPWPGNPDRFISQLGMPWENFSDLAAFGRTPTDTLRRTAQKIGSSLTPALKLPIEVGTGTNLFTGRPIDELYQFPTDDPVINEIISNSPVARVGTSTRTALDTRKSVPVKLANLLSGLRITDPTGGVEAQKEMAAQKAVNEVMRRNPAFKKHVSYYVPEGTPMTADDVNLIRLSAGLRKKAKAASGKKKRAARFQPVAPDSWLPF